MLQKAGFIVAILGGSIMVTALALRFVIGLDLSQIQPLPWSTLLAIFIINIRIGELQSGRLHMPVGGLLGMAWFVVLLVGGAGILPKSTWLNWVSFGVAVFCMALVTIRLRQCRT